MVLSRAQHIISLQSSVPSAASRSSDNSIFDVGLRLTDGKILTLRIELGANFPETAPILRIIDPGVTHEWLDSSGRVAGLTMLYHWNARTSDLGQVVQFALTQFCIKPPHYNANAAAAALAQRQQQQQQQQQRAASTPSPVHKTVAPSSAATQQQQQQQPQMEAVQIPDDFPELDALSPVQLEELMTSESAFTAFLDRLPVVSNISSLKESIHAENAARALKTISKAQQVEDVQKRVRALEEEVERERAKLAGMLQQEEANQVNPKLFADQLEQLARHVDDESEEFITSNAGADGDVLEANLARYRALRVQYHTKMAKAEICRQQF